MKYMLLALLAVLPLALAHPVDHDHDHPGHAHHPGHDHHPDHHGHADDHDHPIDHAPGNPDDPHPAYKFIFDKGIVISESIAVKKVDVEYKGDVIVFTVVHSKADPDDQMVIAKGDAKWEDLQFAIEALDYHDDPHPHADICGDSPLKHLIKSCHGHMHLRDLSGHEKKQAADYAADLAAEAPKKLKVVYHKDHMISISTLDVKQFVIEKPAPDTMDVKSLQDPPTDVHLIMKSPTKLADESFVVAAVAKPPQTCIVIVDLAHLPKHCHGDVKIRGLSDPEKATVIFK